MERTFIGELGSHIGETVLINGSVAVRRDQGKLVFLDFHDLSGVVQGVVLPKSPAMDVAKELGVEYMVAVEGIVNKRPEKNVVAEKQNGDIELQIEKIEILSAAQPLPFELDAPIGIETLLDHRPLTLRSERCRDIFEVQSTIVQAFREAMIARRFTEFQAPGLVGGDAEGGSSVFKVNYFDDQTAYLATSPQLYKQIMVGAFERAFTVAKIFRAERSATTRHLAEATQMDFEMGFIKDHRDVMQVLQESIQHIVARVEEKHADVFAKFGSAVPKAPATFPSFTLREAQEIIEREFGVSAIGEPDMAPEHERLICEYALKELGSDFVFITYFPTQTRAFYTYEEETEAPLSRSFDLLFRGLEINSGSQRIHSYEALIAKMEKVGLDPQKFSFYLQAFKYAMPPHGGCSTGLDRMTMRMLELSNVREAVAFPRDMVRIDTRLSDGELNMNN